MEENFYHDEFEQFLQQQANNHRMYPTDGVWHGIYKKLHGDKKWPALTAAAFAFIIATIAISVYFGPKPNIFEIEPANNNIEVVVNTNKFKTPLLSSVNNTQKNTKGKNLVSQPQPLNVIAAVTSPQINTIPFTQLSLPLITTMSGYIAHHNRQPESKVISFVPRRKKTDVDKNVMQEFYNNLNNTSTDPTEEDYELSIDNPKSNSGKSIKTSTKAKEKDDKNVVDDFLKQHTNDIALFTTTRTLYNKNRFSYTFYIAPSLSYRRLKEDEILTRKSNNANGPVALNFVTEVNKVVRHKPGTGFETGLAFTYHLTNTLGIKAGVQFNLRQYSIEAYKSTTELTSIALLGNNGIDTLNTLAIYRNNNGQFSTELVNRYYQFSVPIGLEWQVLGNNKINLNIAGTIQPTYTANSNSYLLTTNFKNYTQNSGMLRNFTVNSNVEAFIGFKVKDYKWQIGPQFRYQHLPTFSSKYPIREHLVDYGIKVGVSKIIK